VTVIIDRPTADAMPDLSSDYALSASQIAQFDRDGHIYLPHVASPGEIAAYRQAILGAVQRNNTETRALEDRDTYGKAFLQVPNLWRGDEAVRRFTLARRFGKIAADLLSVDGVRLYHDQALFKEPGGGLTPWHQDQQYWPLDTDKTITLWMPLIDVSAESGTMTFASESQREGYMGAMPISDDSEAAIRRLVADRGYALHSNGAMAAGDATFHAGWTLHGAPGNPTAKLREVMTIIYFADGLPVAQPKNANQEADLRAWFPGLAPGDPAAGELNPLVYKK